MPYLSCRGVSIPEKTWSRDRRRLVFEVGQWPANWKCSYFVCYSVALRRCKARTLRNHKGPRPTNHSLNTSALGQRLSCSMRRRAPGPAPPTVSANQHLQDCVTQEWQRAVRHVVLLPQALIQIRGRGRLICDALATMSCLCLP